MLYHQVMPNQAILRTLHLESTADLSPFLMDPHLPHPRPLLLSPLLQHPLLQFSQAWSPLTTLMPPPPPQPHLHLWSRQGDRPQAVTSPLLPLLSLKTTPLQVPPVELLVPLVSPLPPFMACHDQAPQLLPGVAQSHYHRQTPLSRRGFLQTSSQDTAILEPTCTNKQVTPLLQ